MALYGLSVFLETPESQRKGRKRYIAVSFVITALRALAGSIDIANYFQVLFNATLPGHWRDLMLGELYDGWKYLLSNTVPGLIPIIGDALLVRVAPSFLSLSGKAHDLIVAGIPLLYSTRGILVGDNSANDHVPGCVRSVSCPCSSLNSADRVSEIMADSSLHCGTCDLR